MPHVYIASSVCIPLMHLTHNRLCIVSGFPRPFTRLSGTLLPLHCISEILISLHDHCISRDLHPSSYHGISIPLHCIAYQGSLSHCISHLRDFTPTALHIMRSKSHCITYQG